MSKDTQQKIDKLKFYASVPAFPIETNNAWADGMSLRTYIATQLLAAYLSNPTFEISLHGLVEISVKAADALIEELNK